MHFITAQSHMGSDVSLRNSLYNLCNFIFSPSKWLLFSLHSAWSHCLCFSDCILAQPVEWDNQRVGGSISGSHCPRAEVSLGKTFEAHNCSQWGLAVPCMASATHWWCEGVGELKGSGEVLCDAFKVMKMLSFPENHFRY